MLPVPIPTTDEVFPNISIPTTLLGKKSNPRKAFTHGHERKDSTPKKAQDLSSHGCSVVCVCVCVTVCVIILPDKMAAHYISLLGALKIKSDLTWS